MSVPTEFSIDSNTDLTIAHTRITELSAEVERLKASCAYAEERIASLTQVRDTWRQRYEEFTTFWAGVNGEMIEQAQRRGWCSDFDAILVELARQAPDHITIQHRVREVEMDISVRYSSTATRTILVEVQGHRNEDFEAAAERWIEENDFDPTDGEWQTSAYSTHIDEVAVDDVSE